MVSTLAQKIMVKADTASGRIFLIVGLALMIIAQNGICREKAHPATKEREVLDTIIMVALGHQAENGRYPGTFEELEPYFNEYHKQLIAPYKQRIVFLGAEQRLGTEAYVMLPADSGIVVGYIRDSPTVEYLRSVNRSEAQQGEIHGVLWFLLVFSVFGNIACISAYLWRRTGSRKQILSDTAGS